MTIYEDIKAYGHNNWPLDRVIDETHALLARNGDVCKKCGGTDTTIDHVIPKSILASFGINQKQSYMSAILLQLLCRKCNVLKADRIDWNDSRSKEILLKLINEI